MSDTIDESLSALQRSGCIELRDDDDAEFNLDDSEEEERNEVKRNYNDDSKNVFLLNTFIVCVRVCVLD